MTRASLELPAKGNCPWLGVPPVWSWAGARLRTRTSCRPLFFRWCTKDVIELKFKYVHEHMHISRGLLVYDEFQILTNTVSLRADVRLWSIVKCFDETQEVLSKEQPDFFPCGVTVMVRLQLTTTIRSGLWSYVGKCACLVWTASPGIQDCPRLVRQQGYQSMRVAWNSCNFRDAAWVTVKCWSTGLTCGKRDSWCWVVCSRDALAGTVWARGWWGHKGNLHSMCAPWKADHRAGLTNYLECAAKGAANALTEYISEVVFDATTCNWKWREVVQAIQ